MYSETSNKVIFYQNSDQKNHSSDKCVYATVAEAVRDEREERKWRYDSWNARFVGQACSKAFNLPEKSRIELKRWATCNEYVKPRSNDEKGHAVVYIMIYDFEILKGTEEEAHG